MSINETNIFMNLGYLITHSRKFPARIYMRLVTKAKNPKLNIQIMGYQMEINSWLPASPDGII